VRKHLPCRSPPPLIQKSKGEVPPRVVPIDGERSHHREGYVNYGGDEDAKYRNTVLLYSHLYFTKEAANKRR